MCKRVAVIGGGLSGLTTIRQLTDEGHEVTCFEASPDFGGVFRNLGACYKGLKLTVSNYFMAFSDFVPSHQRYRFWSQRDYRKYLGDYVEHFDIGKHIHLNHKVVAVERHNDKWFVTTECDGQQSTYSFDAVAVCSGMFIHKKIPPIEGLDQFSGAVTHAQDFKDAKSYEGKKVLCVGLGESSSDVTSEISDVADKCYLSLRRYPAVAPRYLPFQKDTFFTIDSSWNTVRNFNNVPKKFHKRLTGKLFKKYAKSLNVDTRLRGEWLAKAGPTGDQVINKNERVFAHIADGHVTPNLSGIEKFEPDAVVFKDGERVEIDAIVFCTGYEIRFPFLTGQSPFNLRELYMQMFNADLGDDIAFIGFARPQQGGIPAIAEMQARYFAQVCSGKASLPALKQQRLIAQQHEQHWRKEYPITPDAVGLVNYVHYMDLLAGQIGCLPEKPSYFKNLKLRLKLDYNPIFCAQYRLNGPHAAYEKSKAFLESFPNVFSKPWILYLVIAQAWLKLTRNSKRIDLLSMRPLGLKELSEKSPPMGLKGKLAHSVAAPRVQRSEA